MPIFCPRLMFSPSHLWGNFSAIGTGVMIFLSTSFCTCRVYLPSMKILALCFKIIARPAEPEKPVSQSRRSS